MGTTTALGLQTYELTKRFGSFTALDSVSLQVRRGQEHAGEVHRGYQPPDRGAVLMVSEDLDELLHVAHRIVVMSGGRLVHECVAEETHSTAREAA